MTNSLRNTVAKKCNQQLKLNINNLDLLAQALTHSSYANESNEPLGHNERLEYLGDAVIELVVSETLFLNYPDYKEGELTRLRSIIVCEPTLAAVSKALGLGNYVLLGKGEIKSHGRTRDALLADVYEAVVGAIYLDKGITWAKHFLQTTLGDVIEASAQGNLGYDYKTQLQEYVQQHDFAEGLKYVLVNEWGPDHAKQFEVELVLDGKMLSIGKGSSKKEAEQLAAKEAWQKRYLIRG